KPVRCVGRTAHGAHGDLVCAWRSAEPQVDPPRIEPLERSELLGDDVGRVVRQHDAAGTDPDGARAVGDMADDDRRGGAGDPFHVVVLGDPYAAVAPLLGVDGKVPRVVQRRLGVRILGYADEFEDGEGSHGISFVAAVAIASIVSFTIGTGV